MSPEYDAHHLCHSRKTWEVYPAGAYIRSQLIARNMARSVHNLLHENEAPVPVPGYHTLMRIAGALPKGLDLLEAVDTYCFAAEDSNKHPKIKPIEIELNTLSIRALRAQLPYVKDLH